jgi:hypothetical protein
MIYDDLVRLMGNPPDYQKGAPGVLCCKWRGAEGTVVVVSSMVGLKTSFAPANGGPEIRRNFYLSYDEWSQRTYYQETDEDRW